MTDLTAADWAAMRDHVTAAKKAVDALDAYCLGEDQCAACGAADAIDQLTTDLPLALDALARQQEANARLTAENARLKEDGADHKGAEIADVHAEILHRAEQAEATLADRDATIARLTEAQPLVRVRDLIEQTQKADDWREKAEHGFRCFHCRFWFFVEDGTALEHFGKSSGDTPRCLLTPAKEADRE